MLKDKIVFQTNSLEDYIKENDIIAQDFFTSYFYNDFYYKNKNPQRKRIELIISPKCNLHCKYCYWVNYSKNLFPEQVYNEENIKNNLKLILNWLDKNQFNPQLEFFTGEMFAQQIGFDCLNIVYEYEKNVNPEWRIPNIMIPTNFSFVSSDQLICQVKEIYNKLMDINIPVYFSASFDGLYEEKNRPYWHDLDFNLKTERNEAFYDKMFQTVYELNSGLHPMIYSEGIEKWKDNFLWFQKMMEKHNIKWDALYLLEVRNDNWSIEQIKEFQKFYEFLFDWSYNKLNKSSDELYDFILSEERNNGFNILCSSITRINRGMPCGIQDTLAIRVSDLKIYPCHRTMYDQFYLGSLVKDNNSVLKFESENVELLLTTYGIHNKNLNYCERCPINHLCIGPCFGSNYESNKNIFTPALTVCALEHAKAVSFVKMICKYKIYDKIYWGASKPQKYQLDWLRKEINNYND